MRRYLGNLIAVLVGATGLLHGADNSPLSSDLSRDETVRSIPQKSSRVTRRTCSSPSCTQCKGLELYGQALYWKWTGGENPYAIEIVDIVPPNVARNEIPKIYNPDYQWGFRVGAIYQLCLPCTYVDLSYLRFDRTRGLESFGLPLGLFGTVESGPVAARFGKEHQNVDLTFGYYLCRTRCLAFNFHVGGRWVYFRETLQIEGQTPDGLGRVVGDNTFNGGAFKAGVGGELGLLGLRLFGEFDMLAALGTQNSFEQVILPTSLVPRPEPNSTRAATGFGAKIGVKSQFSCRCCRFTAELGLEMQNYYDVLRKSLRAIDLGNEATDVDAGFGGPYASIRATY